MRADKYIIVIMADKYNGEIKKRESIFLTSNSEGDDRKIEDIFRRGKN